MSWALALTPPNREHIVAASLKRWQFPNALFLVRTRVVHRGNLVDRLRPAFPRYLFCQPRGLFHTLRTRIQGLEFVRDGEQVATVPQQAIDSLIDAADIDGVLPTPEIKSGKFNPGDRLIIRGASNLAGHPAIYKNTTNHGRAIVLVAWFNGVQCPAELDERDLELERSESPKPRRKRRRRRHGHRKLDTPA